MGDTLTNKDYETILSFYQLPIPHSKRALKRQAERILADKLCKCIGQGSHKQISCRNAFQYGKPRSVKLKRKIYTRKTKKRNI